MSTLRQRTSWLLEAWDLEPVADSEADLCLELELSCVADCYNAIVRKRLKAALATIAAQSQRIAELEVSEDRTGMGRCFEMLNEEFKRDFAEENRDAT